MKVTMGLEIVIPRLRPSTDPLECFAAPLPDETGCNSLLDLAAAGMTSEQKII